MKIKIIKNIYSLFNAIAIFAFLTIILLIPLYFISLQEWEKYILIPFLTIVMLLLLLFILRKHLLTTVTINNSEIVVQYFSKKIQSFKFDEFDNVEFTLDSFIKALIIKLYKNDFSKPILTFHMSKKRLYILKQLVGLKPSVNDKIQKARYSFFRGVMLN